MEELLNNYYIKRLIYVIISIILSIAIVDSNNRKSNRLSNKLNIHKVDWLYLIRISCLSIALGIFCEQLIAYFNIGDAEITETNLYTIIAYFITSCIVAPITEEIIFRFGLYEFLNKKTNKIIAIVLMSLIFAIIHFYSVLGTLLLTILSIIWASTYIRKKNLIYSILIHFIYNLYNVLHFTNINNVFYIILCIICFIIWIVIFMYSKRVTKSK